MGIIKNPFKGKTEDKPLTYEEARGLARDEGLDVRRDLAARSDVEPEILYFLAERICPIMPAPINPTRKGRLGRTDAMDLLMHPI